MGGDPSRRRAGHLHGEEGKNMDRKVRVESKDRKNHQLQGNQIAELEKDVLILMNQTLKDIEYLTVDI